jgi:hypothetical protein
VANHSRIPGDKSSSLGSNLAGNPGGAVPPLAIKEAPRVPGPGEKIPETSERLLQLIRRQRFTRLCVLMNPYPAGRAVHPDLAGYRVFPINLVRNHNCQVAFFLRKSHPAQCQKGHRNWKNAVKT